MAFEGEDMAAAKQIAMEISRDKGMPYVNGYDHVNIIWVERGNQLDWSGFYFEKNILENSFLKSNLIKSFR